VGERYRRFIRGIRNNNKLTMKKFYISFGQIHAHAIPSYPTFDKDCIAVICDECAQMEIPMYCSIECAKDRGASKEQVCTHDQ
jgi:hypothetical protein